MAANKVRLKVYKRDGDNKWAWRISIGAEIIAVDGNQGFEDRDSAVAVATKLLDGGYGGDYEIVIPKE